MKKYVLILCCFLLIGCDDTQKAEYHKCNQCKYGLNLMPILIDKDIFFQPIPIWESCPNWKYKSNPIFIKTKERKTK